MCFCLPFLGRHGTYSKGRSKRLFRSGCSSEEPPLKGKLVRSLRGMSSETTSIMLVIAVQGIVVIAAGTTWQLSLKNALQVPRAFFSYILQEGTQHRRR